MEFTGRMSVGGTSTLSLPVTKMIGLMLFDGTSGQRVSLQVGNSTFGVCGLVLTIFSPTALNLGSNQRYCGNLLNTPTLTADGTYTILAETFNGATGSADLALYDVTSGAVPTIVADGTPVSVNIDRPGQEVELMFNGSPGQRISLSLTNGTFPSACLNVSLINPDGTVLTSAITCIAVSGFINTQTLSMTGVYTIALAPIDSSTGSINVALYSVPPDVTGVIVPGGDAVTVNITTPGQKAQLTFNGSAGQKVSLTADGTIPGCGLNISILNPDGTALTSVGGVCLPGSIPAQTLPVTGTYIVSLVPSGASIGSVTLNLQPG
jgi:hypothetical protein